MVFVALFIGIVIGAAIVGCIWWLTQEKEEPVQGRVEKEKVDITVQDIMRLAALNTAVDVSSLIIEYKINKKMPDFYEKYQKLSKHEKDLYFNELIAIFSKNRREYVRDLFDQYGGLSTQDVLLLLMCEMQLDNKTMAMIMGLNKDAFKKRKSRLKVKMHTDVLPVRKEVNG